MKKIRKAVSVVILVAMMISLSAGAFALAQDIQMMGLVKTLSVATIPTQNIDINKAGTIINPYGKVGASMVMVDVTDILSPTVDNLVVVIAGTVAKYVYYNSKYYFVALLDDEVIASDITVEAGIPEQLFYGDVNSLGGTNSTDMNLLKGALVGNRTPTNNFEYIASDINVDLSVNSTDLNLLKGILVGNIVLPTPTPTPTPVPTIPPTPTPIPTPTPEPTPKTTVLYSENFENYTSNSNVQANSGWVVPVQTNMTLGSDSTKYANIVQNSASYAQVTFAPAPLKLSAGPSPGRNAKIIAEYRIARGSFNNGNSLWIAFTDSTAARASEGLSASARMETLPNNYSNANIVFSYGTSFNSGGAGTVLVSGENSSVTTGLWSKIRYEVQITDDRGNYITPAVSAYVNDSPTNVPGIGGLLNISSNNQINALRICTSSSVGRMLVDDISVVLQSGDIIPEPTPTPTVPPVENPGWVYVNDFEAASSMSNSRFSLTSSGWSGNIIPDLTMCLGLTYASGSGSLAATFAPFQLLSDTTDGVSVDQNYNSVTAEFDLLTENLTDTALVEFSKVWAADDGTKISTLLIDGTNNQMYLGKDEANKAAYTSGNWHHVKLELVGKYNGSDSTASGGKQQKLWVDGNLVAGPMDMDSTTNTKVSQLAKIAITLPAANPGAKVYIDNILIKRSVASFVPPVINSVDTTRAIVINAYSKDVSFDISPKFETGKIWVSAHSVAEAMGLIFYDTNNGFVIKNDKINMNAVYGQNYVLVNGIALDATAPYKDGIRGFILLDTLMNVFNSSYTWDAVNNKAIISAPALPADPPSATAGQITSTGHSRDITYEIPYQNPNAKVTVWKYETSVYWRKLYTPVYDSAKGVFTGTVGQIGEGGSATIKVKIEDGASETSFKYTTVKASGTKYLTRAEVLYNATALLLVPTFNNISVYTNCTTTGAINTVKYRKVGDSAWKQALTLTYDDLGKQFRGSIIGLNENTAYEVNVRITNSLGTLIKDETATTTTWAEAIPIAEVINVADIYKQGEPLVLQNIHGTANGYIKIVGDDSTVISVSDEFKEAVFVQESSYIIIENLKIKGGERNGMTIGGGTNNIRVINCDISNWGRAGTFDVSKGLYLSETGGAINNDGAIHITGVSKAVIENCYFHDPKGKSNAWRGPNREWDNIHPQGPNGIYGNGRDGMVVRYNDFVGSDEHRWNDSFETFYNFGNLGGPGYDSDIYGNYQVFGQDDSTELDGTQMNLRYYGNKAEGFLCGVSTAGNMIGPSYIFRNLIINMGDEILRVGSASKNGDPTVTNSLGLTYFFHNTMKSGGTAIAQTNTYFRPYSRNNILETSSSTGGAISFGASPAGVIDYATPKQSEDYDLAYGNINSPAGTGANTIKGQASFVNKLSGDFRLVAGSLGIDKGEILPNFSDGFAGTAPDMGANELGSDDIFPIRPTDIRADKYQLNLSNTTKTGTVAFDIRNVPAGTTYKILTNDVFDKWMTVSVQGGNTGTLTPNQALSVTVTVDTTKIGKMFNGAQFARGNGAFLLKLSNGFSVPITVYATK